VSSKAIASLLACETVIWDRESNLPTAVRIIGGVQVAPGNTSIQFVTLVLLHNPEYDISPHTLRVQVLQAPDFKTVVAAGPPQRFVYGYKMSPVAPGGFSMTTHFNFRVAEMGVYWVQAVLDGELAIQIPLIIQRMQ